MSDRLSVDAEYLYWKVQDSPKPLVLVESGTLSAPGQKVVLGGKHIRSNWRSGCRLSLQYQFDENQCFAAEVNYFLLPTTKNSRTVHSSGLPGSAFLTIPFFDVTIPGDNFTSLSFPDTSSPFSGLATLKVSNMMQGVELNGYMALCSRYSLNFTALAGFRYWNFNERLKFSTSSPFLNTPDVFKTKDKFHAENNFYGGQIGLASNYTCGCLSVDCKLKIALGAICKEAIINGSLESNDFDGFGAVQEFSGGYFALPTNIGHHRRTSFSVIPEVNLNIGYAFSDCLSFQIGYNFLYVTNVLRAAKEMSHRLNPTQSVAISNTPNASLVGEAQPKARLKSEDLWVQGLSVGLNYSF